MSVVLSYGHNEMSGAHIKTSMYESGDMKLFQSHFASSFYFCLVFSVLNVLKFISSAYASAFKLNFHTEYPFAVKLVVACYDETWNADGVAMLFAVAFSTAIEAVCSIVFEGCHSFAISA